MELHEAQQKAVELNTQRQTYQSVLNRLPRLTSTTEVIPFFTGFEQMLIDIEVSETKWLQALQSCIEGQLNTEYWNTTITTELPSSKTNPNGLAGLFRDSLFATVLYYQDEMDRSIQQAIHESTVHVDSLLGDTPPECHRFQWIKARTLAKVKKECAEAVWKSNPKKSCGASRSCQQVGGNIWQSS